MLDKKLIPSFVLIILILVAGCQSALTERASEGEQEMALDFASSAFDSGGTIPQQYTCDGPNISPPLSWVGIPDEAKSLVLIVDDPDASRGSWVHWVLYNFSPDQDGLSEGVRNIGMEGKNDFGNLGYGGPCPPRGTTHRYFFRLSALDTELSVEPGAARADIERAMQGHILAQGELLGRYGR